MKRMDGIRTEDPFDNDEVMGLIWDHARSKCQNLFANQITDSGVLFDTRTEVSLFLTQLQRKLNKMGQNIGPLAFRAFGEAIHLAAVATSECSKVYFSDDDNNEALKALVQAEEMTDAHLNAIVADRIKRNQQ